MAISRNRFGPTNSKQETIEHDESSDLEATMEVTGLLSDRLLPVNAEPVQVMMVMTSDDTKTNGMPPAKYSPRQGKKPNGRKAPDRKVPEEERVIGHRHVPTGRRKGSDTVIEGNMEAVADGMGSDDRGSNTDSSNKERNVIGGSDREGNSSGTNENGDTNISSGNDGGSNIGSSGNDGGSNIGSSGNGADDSQHDSIATGNSEESNAGAGNNPENSDNGSDNEGGGTGTPPPGEGHETPDKRDKTGSDEEEHHREEQSRSRDEQRPQKEDKSRGREVPPHLHVKRHQYGDEEEEDPRPARVLNLRTKLVAKPQRKVRRRLGIKSSAKDGGGDGEREGEDKGEKRKEDEGSEEEESEQEALTVTLENLTLVEGGQIEATQLSIVPALDTPRAPHRLLTPTKYRPKRNNYEKATQTAVDTHLSKSRVNRRSLEERPKWGVNRPERCYLKASQRSLRCLAYLRKRAAPKDSREDSRSPSPLNQSKSSYSESSNRSMNRGTGMANNNKRTISQSSIGVCTPRIIQVLPPSGVASNLSAGKRCLSIRGNIGVMNGSRMTNRPQMVPIEKQHLQQSGFEHQQITSVQEVLYQLTALKHGLQMKQQEWEVSRSQTPYSEISTK
ncbi:hypothetical protein AAG570_013370 [Ranatra chinensis]|uniref:Uncharacterized protein n=1 Tax=Ranatra chinensis TaxID=642074 RepID=A0ABD0YBZ2_9HEMI